MNRQKDRWADRYIDDRFLTKIWLMEIKCLILFENRCLHPGSEPNFYSYLASTLPSMFLSI